MQTIEELYHKDIHQERFAMLVAARVNEILSGTAAVLEFPKAGGVFNTPEEEVLLFADVIARVVCANLNQGEEIVE
jgi:hypothetical protein